MPASPPNLRSPVGYRLLARVPFPLWERALGVRLLVPYYHMVGDEAPPHVRHAFRPRGTREFRRDLEFLLGRFRPVSLPDILASLREGRRLPPRSFHITFDDGFREVCDHAAPVLVEMGVPATFFVNTSFIDNRALGHIGLASLLVETLGQRGPFAPPAVHAFLRGRGVKGDDARGCILSIGWQDRRLLEEAAALLELDVPAYLREHRPYLSSQEVRSLIANGFSIGAHGTEHPLYRLIPPAEQLRQTLESVHELRSRFSLSYGAFAFPHTDRGVARATFDGIAAAGLVDVSFGTAGIVPGEGRPGHIQRFSLERLPLAAEHAIARELGRLAKRALLGREETGGG